MGNIFKNIGLGLLLVIAIFFSPFLWTFGYLAVFVLIVCYPVYKVLQKVFKLLNMD